MDVQELEIDLSIKQHKHIDVFSEQKINNPTYKSKEASLKAAHEEIKLKELERYSDPTVQAGYFHRNDYNDYVSVGVSFSLPVYGTQDLEVQKAKKESLAQVADIADYNNFLEYEMMQVHAKIEDAYRVYEIIHNQSMPQIEHMFELSSSSIKNGEELFIYINLLERKLAHDEKIINVIASYNRNLAELEYLTGEMQ
jgi:hypothetical protein